MSKYWSNKTPLHWKMLAVRKMSFLFGRQTKNIISQYTLSLLRWHQGIKTKQPCSGWYCLVGIIAQNMAMVIFLKFSRMRQEQQMSQSCCGREPHLIRGAVHHGNRPDGLWQKVCALPSAGLVSCCFSVWFILVQGCIILQPDLFLPLLWRSWHFSLLA